MIWNLNGKIWYSEDEVEKYRTTLQDIKRILNIHKQELEECLHNDINGRILDLITKAESEG